MYSKNKIYNSTQDTSKKIELLKEKLSTCDAVIIGAGAGLSTSAGFTYSGERFQKYFSDFIEKYHFKDMYSGGFYQFDTLEEYWAYWSRYVYINRYMNIDNGTYKLLYDLIKDKDYFILTTNVDHQFQLAKFDKNRLFYTQGDYGLFQCSEPCHNKTYDNEKIIKKMFETQKNMCIPSDLIPRCPKCNKPMTMNLRADDTFVQDDGWYIANKRYCDFLYYHKDTKNLYLELGVGYNTPAIIKYPFFQMTFKNPNSTYVCINYGETFCPKEIEKQSICISDDISNILRQLSY